MAIVLNVFAEGENAKEFVKETLESGVLDLVHKEKGNRMYDLFLSRDDDNKVLLVENWENRECLKAHMQGEPYKAFGKITAKYNLKFTMNRFDTTD